MLVAELVRVWPALSAKASRLRLRKNISVAAPAPPVLSCVRPPMSDSSARLAAIRAAFPAEGLFADKEWRIASAPFAIDARLHEQLEKLGHRLVLFQRACNELYFRSVAGKAPAWVAEVLDRGKPAHLIETGRRKETRNALPLVIRPDLVLTEDSFVLAEIDSVPGGIGLTGWLNQTYASFGTHDIIGGASGMIDGFRAIVPEGRVLVSREAATYRPEMQWLARQPGSPLTVEDAESLTESRPHYRFYELFDLPNLPAKTLLANPNVTAPHKAFLEEKLWFALFWSRPLREFWRRELSERHWLELQKVIPFTWIMDPTPLPHHAVLPGLEIHEWRELAQFSQKQRDLVLKISGFSELGWGSRSVTIGSDVPALQWTAAVDHALAEFPHHPWILQRFHRARIVEQPYFDPTSGEPQVLPGRARLCPYYFVLDGKASLRGALATVVPADKKILHGMKDAVLAPTCVVTE